MKEELLRLFSSHPALSVLISLGISLLVAVLGLVPSVFVTAANISFFGFRNGLILSFLGEALGALISFLLYRKGFRRGIDTGLLRHPRLRRLLHAEGREAFKIILALRLLPFVPSGLVTFAGAVGRVRTATFFWASTLGKAPALLLEAWSVYEVTQFGLIGKLLLAGAGVFVLIFVLKKRSAKPL